MTIIVVEKMISIATTMMNAIAMIMIVTATKTAAIVMMTNKQNDIKKNYK